MKTIVLLLVSVLCLWAMPAYAFRCGTQEVSPGDHKSYVEQICGPPTSIESRVIYEVVQSGPRRPGTQSDQHELTVPILIEEWIYKLGPQRLMRWLLFEDGVLLRIRTIERNGYENPSLGHRFVNPRDFMRWSKRE